VPQRSGTPAPELEAGLSDQLGGPVSPVPGGPQLGASLDLLGPGDWLDPSLTVDPEPTQLLDRLQEALMTGAGEGAVDEATDVLLPQVVRGLATLARDGAAEMRLQLEPEDLGTVQLRVRTSRGIVRGELLVERPEIKQLLDANVGRLRTALAESGLHLGGFDVDVERHTGSRQQFSTPDRPAGGRRAAAPAVVGPAAAAAAGSAPAVGTSGTSRAVDYTI